MTINNHNIKKITRRRKMTSSTLALVAIVGSILAFQQPANAAPAAPGNANSGTNTSESFSGSSESHNGEYVPYNMYISPKGHVVSAFEPIRSPAFCIPLFNLRSEESNRAQYRFWTQCILGGRMD